MAGRSNAGQAAFALVNQYFGSIVKALAALGTNTQFLIYLIHAAAASPGGIAQGRFPDGIADANVHVVAPIDSPRLYCEWIAIAIALFAGLDQLRTARQPIPAASSREQAAAAAG